MNTITTITKEPSYEDKREIAEFYLTHNKETTTKKFDVSQSTLQRYFFEIFNIEKSEYNYIYNLKIAAYYLTHSEQQTIERFGLSKSNINLKVLFENVFGISDKIEYIKKNNLSFQDLKDFQDKLEKDYPRINKAIPITTTRRPYQRVVDEKAVAEYYLHNSIEDTMARFNIGAHNTVISCFKKFTKHLKHSI